LTSTIAIASSTTLDGTGQRVTISGSDANGNKVRVFQVNAQVTFNLANLTIVNGQDLGAFGGGGILRYGTLTVTNSTFSGNSGSNGGSIEADQWVKSDFELHRIDSHEVSGIRIAF